MLWLPPAAIFSALLINLDIGEIIDFNTIVPIKIVIMQKIAIAIIAIIIVFLIYCF